MLALGVLMALGAVIAIGVALEVSKPKDDPSLFAPSSPPVAVSATSGASDMASTAQPPAASPPPATTSEPRPADTADAPPVATPEPPPVAPAAAPAPPPAAPTIVGEWVTDVPIGTSSLTLTSDGHCRIRNIFTDEDGIYTYSIDGTLRIQKDSFWSHVVVTWQAQLSPDGESLTVIEPEGAAHVYKRVH